MTNQTNQTNQTVHLANNGSRRDFAEDRAVEREANRLARMTRAQIEAKYGPMSDEEFNEVFGADAE